MKVAIVFPRITRGWWSPPLFAGYLGAVLEEAGHDVSFIDLTFHPERPWEYLAEKLREQQPDFIGVHSQTIFYDDVVQACRVAREELPSTPLIVGGPHACLKPDETFGEIKPEYLVVGEGEYVFRDIVDGKIGEGIIKAEPIKDLDAIPFPARHLFDKRYDEHYCVTLMGSRGCAYKCSFCYPAVQKIFGHRVRYRSAKNVVDEIKFIKETYPGKVIRFHDDSQTTSRAWMQEFCELMVKEDVNIKWESKTRANLVSYDLVKLMKEAGCVRFEFGVESGSDRVRNEILNKSLSLKDILTAFDVCHRLDMDSLAFFIIASPTETPSELLETIELMETITADKYEVTILNPMPLTVIHDMACALDLIMPYQESFKKSAIKNPHFTTEELESIQKALEKGMVGRSMWTDWGVMKRQFSFKKFYRPLYYFYWIYKLQQAKKMIIKANRKEIRKKYMRE